MLPRQVLLPPSDPTDTLVRVASELNAGLSDRDDALTATITSIASLAVRLVPVADHAGVLLCRRGRPEAAGPADGPGAALDRLQVDLGEGPGVDALRGAGPGVVSEPDLEAAGDRWPGFASAAHDRGVSAVVSVALVPRDRPLGAVTLYVCGDAPLPPDASSLLDTFAVPAAMALHAARRLAGLDQAVESRDLICQAKGVLMQRDGIGPDEAFGRMVAASQHTNLKLVDVARWLVDDARRG